MSLSTRAKRGASALCLLTAAGAGLLASAAAQAQTPNSAAVTVLHTFNQSTEGDNVVGAPVLGADGKYVVPVSYNGPNNQGALLEVGTDGTTSVLHAFSDPNITGDGITPSLTALLASDGNYYGVTFSGGFASSNNFTGGTLYQCTPGGVETPVHLFGDGTVANDGLSPNTELIEDSSGNLYGTTTAGGAAGEGTIFKYSISTNTLTILHSFQDGTVANDGSTPYCGLTFGPDGNLYGLTYSGGTTVSDDTHQNVGYGTAFEISPTGQNYTILHDFSDGSVPSDARYTQSSLILGADGYFYGVGGNGGSTVAVSTYGYGVIFRMSTAGNVTVLHSFSDGSVANDGRYAYAPLAQGPDGTLYGDCINGGSTFGNANSYHQLGYGTLYSYKPSTGQYRLLYSFGTDPTSNPGEYPQSAVAVASDGTLYGGTGSDLNSDSGIFYHAVVPPAPVRFDFNQDGNSDLLWYNTASGDLSVWDADDQSILSYGASFTQLAPSSGWQPVAAPDVNDDGYPDLLWWNSQTGELSLWTMQNTTVTHFGSDFGTIPDTTWKPVAAADVHGTSWELVFQNTASGDISVWQMNGSQTVSYGGTLASLGPNTPWQCVGAPDLDGDGYSDLLFWNNQTGEVSYWSANLASQQVLAYHGDFTTLADTTWHLVGSEDTNGDGHPDLLWWNATTGEVSRWLLNGTTVTQFGGDTAQVQDTTWQPTAIR